MKSLLIKGGIPLNGEMMPSGNKNAALPLLAATLLTEDSVTLHNVPQIGDVAALKALIESVGANVQVIRQNSWKIRAQNIEPGTINPDLSRKIRASILLAGPLMARSNKLSLPPPGGDVIGRRRVDTHLLALRSLGVSAEFDPIKKLFNFSNDGLIGGNILLDEASVTATENAIMASVLAKGSTVIRNAASEPHIHELCIFLNKLGAKIDNIGSNLLHITGVDKLHGGEHTIGPDYLEIVSYIAAAVITKGTITIKNANIQNLDMIRLIFSRLGVRWIYNEDDIIVPQDQECIVQPDLGGAIPEISVMPWPAFPSDLMSIAIVVATQCQGSILFHDWMYPSRMFFTDKLVSMGARIVLCDPHRCIVQGPSKLYAETMESPDIRAGMALVLAALNAKGTSIIRNVEQIERGYEIVDKKLGKLGGEVSFV